MTAPDIEWGPAETVHVEIDWYDGPRAGIADVCGVPHRFKSNFDGDGEATGTFLVWPIDEHTLQLEIEQWLIFVSWNDRYEAGQTDTSSHPGHGGIDARWDALQARLAIDRAEVPTSARPAAARISRIDGASRYAPSGPAYRLSWRLL